VITGAIRRAKLQSNHHHHQQTNTHFFYRPDALPVAQPAVSEYVDMCMNSTGASYSKLTISLSGTRRQMPELTCRHTGNQAAQEPHSVAEVSRSAASSASVHKALTNAFTTLLLAAMPMHWHRRAPI